MPISGRDGKSFIRQTAAEDGEILKKGIQSAFRGSLLFSLKTVTCARNVQVIVSGGERVNGGI